MTVFTGYRLASLTTLVATLALPALAHDTWLLNKQQTAQAGQQMDFDSTSGHRFPALETGPKPDRISAAQCRQQGADFALVPGKHETKTLPLSTRPPANGGMVCWLVLKPKEIDLKADKIDGYLKEIDASEAVKQAWASSPQPRRWVESYEKHAKLIVPGTTGTAKATAPVGLTLEFVPEVDLSTGQLKDKLPVMVLKNGAPLAGLSVELVNGRDSTGTWQKSDAQGRITFAAPGPGKWLLRATDLRQTDAAKGRWESHFTTLVFEVLPAQR